MKRHDSSNLEVFDKLQLVANLLMDSQTNDKLKFIGLLKSDFLADFLKPPAF